MKNKYFRIELILFIGCFILANPIFSSTTKVKPNVLWIFIEDASCHISCYGETAIQTPNIDVLAAEGVRFETPLSHLPNIEESRPYTGEN